MPQVYCMMRSGKPLTSFALDVLFLAAQRMFHQEKDRILVVHDDCNGFVRTDWESSEVGGICGVVFYAEVVTTCGATEVEFLARMADMQHFDIEELQWFKFQRGLSEEHRWN